MRIMKYKNYKNLNDELKECNIYARYNKKKNF